MRGGGFFNRCFGKGCSKNVVKEPIDMVVKPTETLIDELYTLFNSADGDHPKPFSRKEWYDDLIEISAEIRHERRVPSSALRLRGVNIPNRGSKRNNSVNLTKNGKVTDMVNKHAEKLAASALIIISGSKRLREEQINAVFEGGEPTLLSVCKDIVMDETVERINKSSNKPFF
jgi:hypothetical protein